MDVAYKLDCEWPLLARREVAARVAGWRVTQPSLARFESPSQLLAFLHAAPASETDAALLALLTLARRDRLAGRTLLQVLLPALKTLAERIVWPACRREELWELLLFHAWQTICSFPLARGHRVAANLVLLVLHETTRELESIRAFEDDHDDVDQLAHVLRLDDANCLASGESLVADAVAAGVISWSDGELILRTRVDGIRVRLLAAAYGVGYATLLKRRQRAEATLRKLREPAAVVRNGAVSDLVLGEERISRSARAHAETTEWIEQAA